MNWAAVAVAIIAEIPELAAIIQKWIALGQTPTVEDIQAELDQLKLDDQALSAAYTRLFPGQTPPQL